MSEAELMRQAIRLSQEKMAEGDGGPFGAIIVRDGVVIAEGWNQVTSANDPTAHAEVNAIREACRRLGTFVLDDCDIYASCEPCPMCLAAIYWARLRRMFYAATREDAAKIGFDDELLYREVAMRPADRTLPTTRLLGEEALEAFRAWDAKPDKVLY